MNTSSRSAGLRGLIVTAIFGALASGLSAVSSADPSSACITVKYSDLNTASPPGALVLYERIRAAAQSASISLRENWIQIPERNAERRGMCPKGSPKGDG